MGGMNIMFVEGNRLRTPPLTDTILNGVTRDSLLVLAREQGMDVSEAPISLDEVEKRHILATLEHTDWNKSQAASILNIERSTLDRKISS